MEATKVIEAACNLDDETGEVLGYVTEQLLSFCALFFCGSEGLLLFWGVGWSD